MTTTSSTVATTIATAIPTAIPSTGSSSVPATARKVEPTAAPRKYTEADVLQRLEAHYPATEYAVFSHVRSATGFSRTLRTADALVLSLWPSRGIRLYCCEVKVTRADWLRELREPTKADEIGAYCHGFYVVTPDRSIIQEGELPPNWGWMTMQGSAKGLRTIKEAPLRDDVKPFEPLFVAALLRNAAEGRDRHWVRRDSVHHKIEAAREDGKRTGGEKAQSDLRQLTRRVAELEERIQAFQQASGLTLGPLLWGTHPTHDPRRIGRFVKALIHCESLEETLRKQQAEIEKKIGELNAAGEVVRRQVAVARDLLQHTVADTEEGGSAI